MFLNGTPRLVSVMVLVSLFGNFQKQNIQNYTLVAQIRSVLVIWHMAGQLRQSALAMRLRRALRRGDVGE